MSANKSMHSTESMSFKKNRKNKNTEVYAQAIGGARQASTECHIKKNRKNNNNKK